MLAVVGFQKKDFCCVIFAEGSDWTGSKLFTEHWAGTCQRNSN